jgi:hypothetical protein
LRLPLQHSRQQLEALSGAQQGALESLHVMVEQLTLFRTPPQPQFRLQF